MTAAMFSDRKAKDMNIVLQMISIAVLAVLYGLAWHNQPAREPVRARSSRLATRAND